MCMECEEIKEHKDASQLSGKTKICKCCGEEKPVEEYIKCGFKNGKQLYKNTCKVCEWFNNRDNIVVYDNWSIEEYRIVMDNLLNEKSECINDIVNKLNGKTLDDLSIMISKIKLKGIKLKVLINCEYCSKKMKVRLYKYLSGQKNYCSQECKSQSQLVEKIEVKCDCCDKVFFETKKEYEKSQNHYCSLNCAYEDRTRLVTIQKACKYCKEPFATKKGKDYQFCSQECHYKWQSENIRGTNHPSYNRITVNCDWCKKEIEKHKYKIEHENYHFCNKECMNEWFRNIYVKTDEYIERSRQNALNNLKNGVYKTNSQPQLIINDILKSKNIEFINEFINGDYAFDNYLIDSELYIEVMGTYWHCDSRVYENIHYEMQKKQIRIDKSKHTFIRNKHNIEILYLWEEDIISNKLLCEKLILEYINNNGNLKDYNSCNYYLGKNNNLKLRKSIITPYMQWDSDQLDERVDLAVKYKPEKYMKFTCDYCDKEVYRLISKYEGFKNHFCCIKCREKFHAVESNKKRITLNCDCCGKELTITKKRYDRSKKHYCSKECKAIDTNTSYKVKCDNCGVEVLVGKKKYESKGNNHYFCSKVCELDFKSLKLITFNCENCGKEKTTTESKYKQSNHHFCNGKCSQEWHNKNRRNDKGQFC